MGAVGAGFRYHPESHLADYQAQSPRPLPSQPSPFEGKPSAEPSTTKPASPEPAPASEAMDVDRPGTPVPPVEVPELMDTGNPRASWGWDWGQGQPGPEVTPLLLVATLEPGALDARPAESPGEPGPLTRKGRKRKTVTWPEEARLREYFYFELDETERGEERSPAGRVGRVHRVPGIWAHFSPSPQ